MEYGEWSIKGTANDGRRSKKANGRMRTAEWRMMNKGKQQKGEQQNGNNWVDGKKGVGAYGCVPV